MVPSFRPGLRPPSEGLSRPGLCTLYSVRGTSSNRQSRNGKTQDEIPIHRSIFDPRLDKTLWALASCALEILLVSTPYSYPLLFIVPA